jgi:hypothetical protein
VTAGAAVHARRSDSRGWWSAVAAAVHARRREEEARSEEEYHSGSGRRSLRALGLGRIRRCGCR